MQHHKSRFVFFLSHSRTSPLLFLILLFLINNEVYSYLNQNGETGLLRMPVAEVMAPGSMALTMSNSMHWLDPDFASEFKSVYLFDHQAALTYSFNPYFECAANIAVYTDKTDELGSETSIGDSRVGAKLIYPPYTHRKEFDLAAIFALKIPSGSRKSGFFKRHVYYADYPFTSGDIVLEFQFPFVINFTQINKGSPFKAHFMFGADFATSASTQNMYQAAIGLEYLIKPKIELFSEVNGETKAGKVLSPEMDPLWVTLGTNLTFNPIQVKAGLEYLVSSVMAHQIQTINNADYRTGLYPHLGAFLNLTLSGVMIPQDNDKDGINDFDDKCPNAPEDFDGFEDEDGCPDLDNDKDGLPDIRDKCPALAEDMDGFEDMDGCPDIDNDKDGVPDSLDKCPNQSEDFDGFTDNDGCPDFDNDKDNLPDSLDKCPNQSEDHDGFADNEGCPDFDNDKDGTPDSLDKCPNEPEDFQGYEDQDGCPDNRIKSLKIDETYKMQEVKFRSDSSLLENSLRELNELWYYLKVNRDAAIEVRAHCDALGSRRENRRKTEVQAMIVKNYLSSRGIEESRIIPKGMGEEFPLTTNETSGGRNINNRLEIIRTQ